MSKSMLNPQQNYSGVTIQIMNPAVNVDKENSNYAACPQACYSIDKPTVVQEQVTDKSTMNNLTETNKNIKDSGYANAYPADYYIKDYSKVSKENQNASNISDRRYETEREQAADKSDPNYIPYDTPYVSSYKQYGDDANQNRLAEDFRKSKNIITELDERDAEAQKNKENSKETRVVALTDEYIRSLENYLNNPNNEIRLMASKEILTRLDEDKNRYDDAALNALLNKMLQDPYKLVRIAALSAFSSQLASGNDYTVQLLNNIQSNPNADREDVLQAADILLKMSAGTEIKQIPNPESKEANSNK